MKAHKASHAPRTCCGTCAIESTSSFIWYWMATAHTAASTTMPSNAANFQRQARR
jgi:hypothetical protein